jgi:hypothetical protein
LCLPQSFQNSIPATVCMRRKSQDRHFVSAVVESVTVSDPSPV